MRFRNPASGHIEEFGEATWLWMLVLGPIYLAYKQMWLQAAIAAVIAVFTGGVSWVFIYPFIAKRIVRAHYAKAGWSEVADGAVVTNASGARTIDVQILPKAPDGHYRTLTEVHIKLVRWTPFEQKFTQEDAAQRLREQTLALGGNAIINVRYEQKGKTHSTAGYVEAWGTAIINESDTIACPYCAEKIKRDAVRCKHCTADLAGTRI